MEQLEQPNRRLPKNTIMFCEKPWQIPALVLGLLVLLTFTWGLYIVSTYSESDYFEDMTDMSTPEFMFRDMAGSGFANTAGGVSPGIVGIGANGVNIPPISSGVIVSSAGHVVTVLHPLKGIKEITAHVKTPNGVKGYSAEIVKSLPSHNLALLKILSPDHFLFFPLFDTSVLNVGEKVMGLGFGTGGSLISKQGQIHQINTTLSVGAMQLSHLIRTDAIYSWEQNGGPIINIHGELVGINMSIVGDNGAVQGYAVPSHVIKADFGDVVGFKKALPHGQVQAMNAAMPKGNLATLPSSSVSSNSSAAWWARARAQAGPNSPFMGMNIAAPNTGTNTNPAPISTTSPTQFDMDHLGHNRIGGFRVRDIIGLAFLALIVGITSGMMTMGGGVLHVAGMIVFFGYGMHLIRPVAYLTSVFIFGAAARRNINAGLVSWDMVKSVTPWAVIGVLVGYFVGNNMDERLITTLLGLFAALMTARGLHELFNHDDKEVMIKVADNVSDEQLVARPKIDEVDELDAMLSGDTQPEPQIDVANDYARKLVLGLPAGLFSGILGISGGVIAVPMQRFFAAVPLQNAIANSSIIVFWASLAGAIVAFAHGIPYGLIEWQAPLTLTAIMVPGAYLGGMIGAKLMKELPVIALKTFYTIIMSAVAIKMLFMH